MRPAIQTTTNTLGKQSDEFLVNCLDRVPDFVLDYAPMVHLHSKEPFWPASLEEHLKHTVLHDLDGGIVEVQDPFSILQDARFNHEKSFLTAKNDVRSSPHNHPWLVSFQGKPTLDHRSNVSKALLILVDKSLSTGVHDTLDAFWFFFYSFNLGPTVANIHFGNHIADWEHCMMRFENGTPKAVHLSSHADGFAYTYECLEKWKDGKRPVIYSALGSHAMYPKPGHHDYSPIKIIGPSDDTDKGPIWDPRLNYASFQHFTSPARDKFRVIDPSPHPQLLPCLTFRGQWGDQFSSSQNQNQQMNNNNNKGNNSWIQTIKTLHGPMKRTVGLYNLRWGDGVTGPRDKDLDRIGMNRFNNHIRTSI